MAAIPTILQVVVAFLGAYLIALWFSMIIWTYYDIRARSQDLYVHIFATALVVVFNLFGLILYFILRPRETLADAYERSLEEETLLQEIEERQSCPNCRQRVHSGLHVLPLLPHRAEAALPALRPAAAPALGPLPLLWQRRPAPCPRRRGGTRRNPSPPSAPRPAPPP